MSILLDKRELKKAAKELSVTKINEVISILNEVLADRQREIETIEKLQAFAKEQGFTLEQLGYKLSNDAIISAEAVETESKPSGRPTKPKFKTINVESQFFYVEDGKLSLLKTHTMKKGLIDRGIDVFPFSKVDKKFSAQVQPLLDSATLQATESFNAKVVVWNVWAKAHGEEILSKK
ncbi:H-NS family histone-like protein [Rheinheimera faecalis]